MLGYYNKHLYELLNPELIAAPKDCIDYVITHKLCCHLKGRNHIQAFYELMTSVEGLGVKA